MIKVKPKHIIYRGNSTIIKEGHVKEFYKQLPQFTNTLPDQKLQVILKIIGSAYSNRARRVLSTSKSGHALYKYTSPLKTEARDETTLPQLLYVIQPIDVTTTPLYGIPSPQPVTLVASNTINIGDIEIKIQSIGLTGRLIVRVV